LPRRAPRPTRPEPARRRSAHATRGRGAPPRAVQNQRETKQYDPIHSLLSLDSVPRGPHGHTPKKKTNKATTSSLHAERGANDAATRAHRVCAAHTPRRCHRCHTSSDNVLGVQHTRNARQLAGQGSAPGARRRGTPSRCHQPMAATVERHREGRRGQTLGYGTRTTRKEPSGSRQVPSVRRRR